MKQRTLIGSVVLLIAGVAVSASAYHIDAAANVGGSGLTAADWVMASPFLDVCESEWGSGTGGPAGGLPSDDRNSNPPQANPGSGGLCTTGENDATGSAPLANPLKGGIVGMPAKGTYIRLDVCTSTTMVRNGGALGPFPGGGAGCAPTGTTDQHGYVAEVGAFSCFVPTNAVPGVLDPTVDYGFYYDSLYAWWAYDGGSDYTPGDPVGAPHSGDGDAVMNPLSLSENEDAYHGHVAVFIDMTASKTTASTQGSVETIAVAPAVLLANTDALSPFGWNNSCGGSPACQPNVALGPSLPCVAPYGPVLRAP